MSRSFRQYLSVNSGRRRISRSVVSRADKKSQVGQCLGFNTIDVWSLLAYESAEEDPKQFLN